MTPRQQRLLHAIVEYYVQTANPVGSLALSKKLGSSPATLRAEMAALEVMGYIGHPHTSAGRVPTDKGYRHYVDYLQDKAAKIEHKRSQERTHKAVQQRISSAGEPEQALKSAVDSLVDVTHNLALGTMGNALYMNGLSHLFAQPEFINTARVYEVARLLDNLEPWLAELAPHQKLSVYIGDENPIGKTSGCALIISRFASPTSERSYIGVVGPTRQSYPSVMQLVESVGETLEEVLNE